MASGRTSLAAQLLPLGLLLIAMTSIQSGASLAKGLFPMVGAPGITALRILIGAIILTLIFKPWRIKLTRDNIKPLMCYSMALGGMNYLFYLALASLPLGIAVALEFTGPLAVALFGSRRPIDFLWVILAIAGLLVLLPIGQTGGDLSLFGVLCALGAGACWAIYILAGKKAGGEHGPAAVAFGTVISAMIFVPIGVMQTDVPLFTLEILPIALAIAVLSTAFPYTLEIIALTKVPARTFGTLMSLEPAVAAVSGMILLSEHLTLMQWGALGAIILASMGSTLTITSTPKINSVE